MKLVSYVLALRTG